MVLVALAGCCDGLLSERKCRSTVQGGIDPGDFRSCPQVVEVVLVWKDS